MLRQVRKEIFLCLLSGVLLILSFPRFNLWFLAWFGFVPLFCAIKDQSGLKVFLLSYLTGMVFWFGNIYWLVHVTLIGLIVLVCYLALYFGFFGLFFRIYSVHRTPYTVLMIPSAWVLLEYIRSYLFTGFPWSLLGYSQYLNLPIIQIADITGAWGVSFLVMMGNLIIYEIISQKSGGRSDKLKLKNIISLPIIILVLSLGYGYYRLNKQSATGNLQPIRISVVQGNIPQELKWTSGPEEQILEKYLNLSRQAAKDHPDLMIWPEAALPVVLQSEPRFIQQVEKLAEETKTPLLLGAVTLRDDLYYNSAVLVSGQVALISLYDKLHLVPFGEYIPLKQVFGFLQTVVPIGEIERGKNYTIFKGKAGFAVLICFEDLFPELSREFVKRGANFLVNITNDAWYKQTSAPYQHFQASVFRAVENRVYLVRSANTGISGFILPSGKISSLVKNEKGKNIFVPGYDTQNILIGGRNFTFYTRYGNIFIWVLLIFIFYSIIAGKKRK
ncbi:MAG: apolipoprotein N-acyltransferase [Candidatus Omnitrophica bacterium]|nr:apolipoprotein N-acyltransferase [Candidatus Omnitrophota bacterium]